MRSGNASRTVLLEVHERSGVHENIYGRRAQNRSSLVSQTDPMTKPDAPKPHHLLVAIVTTSGSYPDHGFDEVPEQQPIKVELDRAVDKLHITNTTDWIATVGGNELQVNQSYAANQLHGQVEISYGPRETGGG